MPRSAMPAALIVLGSLALASPTAGAQTPAERDSLGRIRAAFQDAGDTLALVNQERRRIAVARVDRDNPYIHMELGWLSFRLGELTGNRRRYQDAASEFQWAADLRPAWPWAWYHLGLAELATGEAGLIVLENIRQLLRQDHLSMAIRSFARAIEADPTFSLAVVDLASTALRQRVGPRLEIARAALGEAAAGEAGLQPTVQLWRGRIERRVEQNDTALAAFHRYLELGGDSVIGLVELARTQALFGRLDSTRVAYGAALARPMSDSARAEVRRDIRWIATRGELAEWDAGPDSAGAWLRRFWSRRDLVDGRRPGERLMEQMRRYQYAVTNYRLVSRHRGNDVGFAYRDTSQAEFDDRGVVYLRHGEPSRRARYTGQGVEQNESWVYRRDPPDDDLVIHFAAVNDVQDFRLVESLVRACVPRWNAAPETQGFGSNRATTTSARAGGGAVNDVASLQSGTTGGGREGDALEMCLASRQSFGGIYERMARPGGLARQVVEDERLAVLAATRQAVGTDSYRLRFTDDLAPVVSYFAVADRTGRPELHLVFAVPVARLHPVEREGSFDYMLSLRMLVFDSTRRQLAELDTVRVFRARERFGPGTYLTEQLAVAVPAGPLRFTFVVEEPRAGTGASVTDRPLEVPPLRGDFAASDVVMGREGSGLVWRRPEGTVALNPLMRFPEDGTAELFYELYGLPQGAGVGTRVRITRRGGRSLFRRLFGGGGSSADLAYVTTTDAEGLTRVRQHLDLRGLGTGRYTLEVELTDPATGRKLVRRAPFEIVPAPET